MDGMAAFLLISPFRGCDSSQIPWSRTEHFGSGSWRVRSEHNVSHNNLTAQSPSWRSAQPLNQGHIHRAGMWQLLQCKRAPGTVMGAAPAGRKKLGFTHGGNCGIAPSRAYLHLLESACSIYSSNAKGNPKWICCLTCPRNFPAIQNQPITPNSDYLEFLMIKTPSLY